MKVISRIATILLVVVCSVFVILAGSILVGYKPVTIQSNSMSPAINVGSLCFIHSQDDYRLNDVITFNIEGTYVTHRIACDNGDGTYVTKGDANSSVDSFILPKENIKGKVALSLPWLGYVVAMLSTLVGKIAMLVVMLVLCVISIVFGRSPKKEKSMGEFSKEFWDDFEDASIKVESKEDKELDAPIKESQQESNKDSEVVSIKKDKGNSQLEGSTDPKEETSSEGKGQAEEKEEFWDNFPKDEKGIKKQDFSVFQEEKEDGSLKGKEEIKKAIVGELPKDVDVVDASLKELMTKGIANPSKEDLENPEWGKYASSAELYASLGFSSKHFKSLSERSRVLYVRDTLDELSKGNRLAWWCSQTEHFQDGLSEYLLGSDCSDKDKHNFWENVMGSNIE